MGTVRERLAGRALSGSLALLGVLLVVPSLFSPTWEMVTADREHGSLLSRQWEWSWGRVREAGLEGVELRDQWNLLGLGVLVVLLAAALVGVAVWLPRRVAWGRVIGLVTIALLTGRVLTTVSDRVGRSLGEVDQGASGLTVRTEMTPAGSLETASAVLLVIALALLVSTAIHSAGRPVNGGAASDPVTGGRVRGGPPVPVGEPVGLRPVGEPVGLRPVGEHLTGRAVGLTDTDQERR